MKEIRSAPVEHILWGPGQVTKKAGNVISVRFAEKGNKEFLYPDAFDKYLVMCDAEQREIVLDDLARKKAADKATREEERRLVEDAKERRAIELVLLAAQQRKSKARTKKPAAKKASEPDSVN